MAHGNQTPLGAKIEEPRYSSFTRNNFVFGCLFALSETLLQPEARKIQRKVKFSNYTIDLIMS